MAALTRQQARALALTLYYSAAGRHDLDDNQFNVVLDTINKKYWLQAVTKAASLLAVDSADQTTDGSGGFDYSGTNLDANGVHQILAVEFNYANRYIHLDYVIPQDRYQYNLAYGQVQALIPSAFTLLGEKLVLLPRISGSLKVRFTYVPNLPDLASESQTLLGGKLPSFHPLVAYEAALLLLPKGADRTTLFNLVQDLRVSWNDHLTSRQRQLGKTIRAIEWE